MGRGAIDSLRALHTKSVIGAPHIGYRTPHIGPRIHLGAKPLRRPAFIRLAGLRMPKL